MSQPRRKVEKSSPSLPAGQVATRDTRPGGPPLLVPKRRHTLDELLAQCDGQAPISADMVAWEAAKSVGQEIL